MKMQAILTVCVLSLLGGVSEAHEVLEACKITKASLDRFLIRESLGFGGELDPKKEGLCFEGLNFSRVHLLGLKAEDARLKGADFFKATLRLGQFSRADLREVNFEEADLRGINFEEADLRGANFRKAHLKDANLSGAILDAKAWKSLKKAKSYKHIIW